MAVRLELLLQSLTRFNRLVGALVDCCDELRVVVVLKCLFDAHLAVSLPTRRVDILLLSLDSLY